MSGQCVLASVWAMKAKLVILLSSKGLSIVAAITAVTDFVVLEYSYRAGVSEHL